MSGKKKKRLRLTVTGDSPGFQNSVSLIYCNGVNQDAYHTVTPVKPPVFALIAVPEHAQPDMEQLVAAHITVNGVISTSGYRTKLV